MLKRRLKNPIFLIYLLVFYITVQFSWWLYLIFTLYNKIYTEEEILLLKTWMLLGEGSVFFLILIVGILFILRAFKREKQLIKQQENFVLSVTHELKTPISSIKLFLQTLKKRTLDPNKQIEIYDQSLGEINRLDNLVSNILITRNIQNKNYFLNKVEIDLDAFILEKLTSLSSGILKNHTLKSDLKNIRLAVDKIAFESILVNILENAVKYSPKGGKIEVYLNQNDTFVNLEIRDEGPGISKSDHIKVFSQFFRKENEMTRKSKGTGLGLYITKFLVEEHNGEINLSENDPTGLIVSIRFKK